MAEFADLWEKRHEVLEVFFEKSKYAEENRFKELQMATNIQRVFRASCARAWLTKRKLSAVLIQRIFRGYIARREALERIDQKIKSERMDYFHKQAVNIQKIWRGFYSRKYTHSYFARKAYIRAVVDKGEQMKAELEASLQQQIEDNALRAVEEEAKEFKKLAANLHHLVSTEGIPGIYNSPYQQDCIPTAFNIPVETHLRETYKENMPTKRRIKRPSTVDNSFSKEKTRTMQEQYRSVRLGLRGPFKYPEVVAEIKNRRPNTTIQAASNYDAVREASWQEYKYSKIERIQQPDFVSVARPKTEYTRSISQGTRYGVRVPRPREEVDKRARVSELPFHVSFSGNKLFADNSLPINATQLPKLA